MERILEDIRDGKVSIRALKDCDMDLVLRVARKLRETNRIDQDTYIRILDYMGRLSLARLLGYEDVPEPDPEAPEKLVGLLRDLGDVDPVEVVRDVRKGEV